MARKFRIGDTVQVVKDTLGSLTSYFKIGHRGIVTQYDSGCAYPYDVERKNGNKESFNVKELKLIRKGK